MTTYPTCPYCKQPLTDNERDWEPGPGQGGFFAAHFACTTQDPDGAWYVRTVQHAATPPRVKVERYRSQRRAREQAMHLRTWNRREWPCGARLDIFVGRGSAS